MQHVIDFASERYAGVPLTTTDTGGLIGRSLLADRPLETYLYDTEQPRYCLRNHRRGVSVDGADTCRPDRWYAGFALLTDCRILFTIGQTDGDETRTVPYMEVTNAWTEDGFLGETLVVETADATYRFPCLGELDPVADYVDRVVDIWTEAEERLEDARRTVARLADRLADSEPGAVLSSIEDIESELGAVRETIAPLPGGVAVLGTEIATVEGELTAIRRRAHAAKGDRLAERAARRGDERAFEAALDDLEAAQAAYTEALSIDGDTPTDTALRERREDVLDDRQRLVQSPLESARSAREVAMGADDPQEAIRWWQTTLDRYETAYTLDWGRDDPRFDLDRQAVRDSLADAVGNLIEAYCRGARQHADAGAEYHYSDPEPTSPDRAAELLGQAEALARERLPGKLPEVHTLAAEILPEGAGTDWSIEPETDRSVVDQKQPTDGEGHTSGVDTGGMDSKSDPAE